MEENIWATRKRGRGGRRGRGRGRRRGKAGTVKSVFSQGSSSSKSTPEPVKKAETAVTEEPSRNSAPPRKKPSRRKRRGGLTPSRESSHTSTLEPVKKVETGALEEQTQSSAPPSRKAPVRARITDLYIKPDKRKNPGRKLFSRDRVDSAKLGVNGFQGSVDSHLESNSAQARIMRKKGFKTRDRAILCMSDRMYDILRQKFDYDSLREPNAFGENILVEGLSPEDLCIGDVFEVHHNGKAVACMDIPYPRAPCYKVDKKHGQKYRDRAGVRQFCLLSACAGWFFRVQRCGAVAVGDELVLVERKHPQFPLSRVAHLIYSDTDARGRMKAWPGDEETLQSLLRCPELGMFEWKDNIKQFVANRDGRNGDHQKRKSGREKKKSNLRFWETFM